MLRQFVLPYLVDIHFTADDLSRCHNRYGVVGAVIVYVPMVARHSIYWIHYLGG